MIQGIKKTMMNYLRPFCLLLFVAPFIGAAAQTGLHQDKGVGMICNSFGFKSKLKTT
jgi:hypothetical protein